MAGRKKGATSMGAVAEPILAPVPGVMPAGEFKAKCLQLMNRVQAQGAEIVITKHGKPVAKLVPVGVRKASGFGCMRGTVTILGDIISPVEYPESADEHNIFP